MGGAGATAATASAQATIATNTATAATVSTQTLSVTTQINNTSTLILQTLQQMNGTLSQQLGAIDRLATAQAQCCARGDGGGTLGTIGKVLGIAAAGLGAYGQISQLPRRAGGGHVMAGGRYIVGEEGWEVFSPDRSGTIYNQSQFASRGNGRGSVSININVADAKSLSSPRTKRQIMAEYRTLLQDLDRRGD